MLYRLACKPQILNAVAMASAAALDLRGHATEHVPGARIYGQGGFALQPPQGRKAFLPNTWV